MAGDEDADRVLTAGEEGLGRQVRHIAQLPGPCADALGQFRANGALPHLSAEDFGHQRARDPEVFGNIGNANHTILLFK